MVSAAMLAAALVCATAVAAMRTPSQIYFYAGLSSNVPGTSYAPNAPVVRPSIIAETYDGSVALIKLSWTGWGSSVAHADGILSASNCTPSCAQGKRTTHPAQVTLSSPAVVFGHTAYRCFRLTVPASPKSNQQMCLGPVPGGGNLYGYIAPKAVPPSEKVVEVVFYSSLPGGVGCAMSASASTPAATAVVCQASNPHDQAALAHGATLKPTGLYATCGTTCIGHLAMDKPPPIYPVGKRVTVGPFTCTVETDGFRCVVTATGKGFLFNEDGVTAVP